MKSSLVTYTKISPNTYGKRANKVCRFTIHHAAGNIKMNELGNLFAQKSRKACSNYGIGTDGTTACFLEEEYAAMCSSSRANDNMAITVEVANDSKEPDWHVSDKAIQSLINLCVDVCKRYNKKKLLWFGNKSESLSYKVKEDEMIVTVHNWFANTTCPGPYLQSKIPIIVEEVNKRIGNNSVSTEQKFVSNENVESMYCVQVGAFEQKSNATAMLNRLKKDGFDGFVKEVGKFYKVQVGAFRLKSNADLLVTRLKRAGYNAFTTK